MVRFAADSAPDGVIHVAFKIVSGRLNFTTLGHSISNLSELLNKFDVILPYVRNRD